MSTDNDSRSGLITKDEVLSLLFELYPWARSFRSAPLRDYAAELFSVPAFRSKSSVRCHAMVLLQAAIERVARARGCSEAEIVRFREEISVYPVMQTGPHLHLLFEPDAFYTHLFSLMGIYAHKRQSYISYACSTVKFVERGRKGPAWLRIEDQSINVFGLTRSKMIPYSILARNSPYRFELLNVDHPERPSETLLQLKAALPKQEFCSAADAIKTANQSLWSKYFSPTVSLLQFDDDDVADLVVDHLVDRDAWLSIYLVGNLAFARSILAHISDLEHTPWRGWLKNSTDYFWGSDQGRLFPLVLDGPTLRARGSELLSVPFTAARLTEELRARRIIPNLLTMFIVTSILPKVRVLGGSRHTVYFPLMRHVFCSALAEIGGDDALLSSIAGDMRICGWGHRVICEDAEPFQEIRKYRAVDKMLDRSAMMSLKAASGAMPGFIHDPQWAYLHAAFTDGPARPDSPPWSFA